MAQPERPLGTIESVRGRLADVRGKQHRTELELRYCPHWRWSTRRTLKCEIEYLSGLAEGLRLSVGLAESGVFPPTDPGKPS